MSESTLSDRSARVRVLSIVLSVFVVAFLAAGCGGSSGTSAGGASGSSAGAMPSSVTGGAGGSMSASSGAASCPTSNTTSFAKTKFVTHSGLAFGAFHRYLYKPFRAGTFQSGAHGRIAAIVKAGVAVLFIKREVRLAYEDVQANPTLCKTIGQPLQAVGNQIDAAVSSLKNGDAGGITALEGLVQSVKSKATSAGTPIQENPNPPLS